MPRLLLLTMVFAASCTPTPKAPQELDDLTRFLFREWDFPDPEAMVDGLLKLEAFLAERGLENDLRRRSFDLASPTEEDLADVERPEGTDPANTIGMSVGYESRWPLADHVRLQVEGDLMEAEPTAKKYVRRFVEPADPACFPANSCEIIRTENEITRSNPLLSVDLTLLKDFRMFVLPDGRKAVVARAWNPEIFVGEDPNTAIVQSYTVDLWIEQASGKTWRYQSLYSENKLDPLFSDRQLTVDTVTSSTDEMFRKTDEVIGKRYHDE